MPTDAVAIRWRLLFLSAFAHSSVMIRSATLTEVGAYDEAFSYAQDYELWSRIARTGDYPNGKGRSQLVRVEAP